MKFYCKLYKIPKKECSKRINEALKVVNLNEHLKKIVRIDFLNAILFMQFS